MPSSAQVRVVIEGGRVIEVYSVMGRGDDERRTMLDATVVDYGRGTSHGQRSEDEFGVPITTYPVNTD